MLGPPSLKGWTMSSVRRWKRLILPHGVFHVPKSVVSLSDALESDISSRAAGTLLLTYIREATCRHFARQLPRSVECPLPKRRRARSAQTSSTNVDPTSAARQSDRTVSL